MGGEIIIISPGGFKRGGRFGVQTNRNTPAGASRTRERSSKSEVMRMKTEQESFLARQTGQLAVRAAAACGLGGALLVLSSNGLANCTVLYLTVLLPAEDQLIYLIWPTETKTTTTAAATINIR